MQGRSACLDGWEECDHLVKFLRSRTSRQQIAQECEPWTASRRSSSRSSRAREPAWSGRSFDGFPFAPAAHMYAADRCSTAPQLILSRCRATESNTGLRKGENDYLPQPETLIWRRQVATCIDAAATHPTLCSRCSESSPMRSLHNRPCHPFRPADPPHSAPLTLIGPPAHLDPHAVRHRAQEWHRSQNQSSSPTPSPTRASLSAWPSPTRASFRTAAFPRW